ncbi:MAG: hypothetical protein DMENIID0002_15420 (plasmid) [Rickettsia endosymbiont of Sergentomyia squamirostris]|uniref:DnaA N-terminal domain-containing protein n=1 Tax=Candidatus Tisiphia endosymbiont of Sergentomyia squamirostris TaxID=3113639 RepID=A0AAT9GAZ5_9RICK
MQILPYNSPINSIRLSLDNHQLPSNLLIGNKFDFISLPTIATENQSYTPYPTCVLEHILYNHDLTSQEKLFYILADSLSMINHATGKQRNIALPATKWASKLNCSAAKIFTLQKSLEEKSYFSIYRDFNKNGKNKRNVITPTLPDAVFNLLANIPNRFNASTSYSNLASDAYLSHLEDKRAYLDRTKMFIRLDYQPLLLITSHHDLSDYSKILWLDFFATGYRYYLKHRSINKNVTTTNIIDIDDDYTNNLQSYHNSYSLTSTYQELQNKYCCSKPVISKALKELADSEFIIKQHLFVKNDDQDDNLHDKSIWRIIVTIPANSQQQSILAKSTAKTVEQRGISHCDPYISNSCYIYNKYSILNPTLTTNIEDADSIDSSYDFFTTEPTSNSDVDQLSELSISYKNSLEEKIVSIETTLPIIKTQESKIEIEKSNNLPNKTLEILEKVSDTVKGKQILPSKPLNKQNDEEISDTTSLVNTEPATSVAAITSIQNKYLSSQNKPLKYNKSPTQAKPLKSFYPLTKEQVDKLNCLSGRKFGGFSVNFANQLLLKLSHDPNKLFLSKNHMMSYMSKAFRYEKHQAPMVNHETFRFTANVSYPESVEMRQKEKYLSEVEYSMDTSYTSQLRKKIAGIFDTKLAYQILTEGEFDYHATYDQKITQELEIKNDDYHNLELPEENNITKFEHVPNYSTCFVDSSLSLTSKHDVGHIRPFTKLAYVQGCGRDASLRTAGNVCEDSSTGITYKSPAEVEFRKKSNITLANTCTIKLPRDLTLTNYQQKNLEKAISTVYGYVKIVYQQLPAIYKKLGSSRLLDEISLAELDQNSVWYKIRKKLIDNFDEHIDKAWFSKLIAEEDAITQTLTLIAPTNFLRDWINAKYSSVITDIAKKLDYQFVELITKKQSSLNVA